MRLGYGEDGRKLMVDCNKNNQIQSNPFKHMQNFSMTGFIARDIYDKNTPNGQDKCIKSVIPYKRA